MGAGSGGGGGRTATTTIANDGNDDTVEKRDVLPSSPSSTSTLPNDSIDKLVKDVATCMWAFARVNEKYPTTVVDMDGLFDSTCWILGTDDGDLDLTAGLGGKEEEDSGGEDSD